MATTRIKDLSKTATTVNSDANLVLDGNTGGTQKITRDNFRQDTADAFVAAPGTYNLAPINSGTGKIDATYLPTSSDTPKGAWNANTNTPTLADGSGTAGDYYDVTVAGSSDLGSGSITFTVGDVVKYDGTTWFKIDSVTNILDGVSTIDGAKAAIEIPDVGTDPSEVPLNQHLGSMAYQSADSVSVAELEVTDKIVDSVEVNASVKPVIRLSGSGNDADGTNYGSIEFYNRDASIDGPNVGAQIHVESSSVNGAGGELVFSTERSSSEGEGSGPIQRLRIDDSGRVGIGVSPSNPLDVVTGNSATFSVLGEGTHSLICGNTNTNSSADLRLYSKDEIRFNTGSTASGDTRVTIDSSGRLGVNQTAPSTNANSIADDLVVGNTGQASGITVVGGTGSTSAMAFGSGGTTIKGGMVYDHPSNSLQFSANSATRWLLNSSGNLQPNGAYGIDFGSGASTTLDAYEEGLWSATLTPATSGTITVDGSVNALRYTIVGRVAHIQGKLNVTAVSSPVGNFVKVSLPAAVGVPDINEESGSTAGSVVVIGAAGAMNDYTLLAIEGSDHLRIYKGTSSTTAATAPDFSGDEEVYINATYIIS